MGISNRSLRMREGRVATTCGRWRRLLRCGLTVALVAAAGLTAMAQLDSPWMWGPHLGAFGSDYATVTWKVSRPVEIEVRYGQAALYDADGSFEETLAFPRHQGLAEIRLDGLVPGTGYVYQVVVYEGDAVHPGPVGRFATSGGNAEPTTVLVYGNTAGFPERQRVVIDAMRAFDGDAALLVNVGPLVRSNDPEGYAELFEVIGPFARDHPYVAVAGASERGSEIYYDSFALPTGGGIDDEQWWSIDLGGVHFVALDVSTPEGPEAAALIAEQVTWLTADLAASSAELKVVFVRDPIYSSTLPDGVDKELRLRWEGLLRDGGVDLVVAGGASRYEHLYVGGVHHVVCAGGGGPFAAVPPIDAAGLVFSRYSALHYLRLTIAGEALRVEAIPVATVYAVGLDEQGAPIEEVHLVPGGEPMDRFTLGRSASE